MHKMTRSSCRGPRFESQHPYGESQPSRSPFPGDPMPSSGLHRHCMYMEYMHSPRNIHIHTHTKLIKKNLRGKALFLPLCFAGEFTYHVSEFTDLVAMATMCLLTKDSGSLAFQCRRRSMAPQEFSRSAVPGWDYQTIQLSRQTDCWILSISR